MITLLEKDWGFLIGEFSKYKFDFLPRITSIATPHVLEIVFGFFCFRLQLTIWSRAMQEFHKSGRRQ